MNRFPSYMHLVIAAGLAAVIFTAAACSSSQPSDPGKAQSPAPTIPTPPTIVVPGANLVEINMMDTQSGWGIGRTDALPDQVLRTEDGGLTWQDRTPGLVQSGRDQISAHFFSSSSNGWVLPRPFETMSQGSDVLTLRSENAGESWLESGIFPQGEMMDFFIPIVLQFTGELNGYLLVSVGAGMSHEYVGLYTSSDGGNTWQLAADPTSAEQIQGCIKTGMHFSEAGIGWITADCMGIVPGAILFQSQDRGRTWVEISLPPPGVVPDLFDLAVCLTSTPTIFPSGIGLLIVMCQGSENDARAMSFLYLSENSGQTWTSHEFPGGQLYPIDENQLIAAGGEVFISEDGGHSWIKTGNAPYEGSFNWVDGKTGWLLSSEGKLTVTMDGGQSWRPIEPILIVPVS